MSKHDRKIQLQIRAISVGGWLIVLWNIYQMVEFHKLGILEFGGGILYVMLFLGIALIFNKHLDWYK